MDDLDDLLLGPHALDELLADGPLLDARHELLDDVVIDVGLEQRRADLAQALADVRLGQQSAGPEPAEGAGEAFLNVVEHGGVFRVR